jgi:hypothetical protein
MNWKGFGNKWSSSNSSTTVEFVWKDEENHDKLHIRVAGGPVEN